MGEKNVVAAVIFFVFVVVMAFILLKAQDKEKTKKEADENVKLKENEETNKTESVKEGEAPTSSLGLPNMGLRDSSFKTLQIIGPTVLFISIIGGLILLIYGLTTDSVEISDSVGYTKMVEVHRYVYCLYSIVCVVSGVISFYVLKSLANIEENIWLLMEFLRTKNK